MLTFKVTNQSRTLQKHVQFVSDFGKYEFKGSADLTKFPEEKEYHLMVARLTVFEKTDAGSRYVGKIRAKGFDAAGQASEYVPDVPQAAPFTESQLKGLLNVALTQLRVV